MQIKKSLMEKVLKQCIPGIEYGSSLIVGSDAFIFENGNVHVYNDSISVSAMNIFPEDLTGAVKAKDFIKLLSKLKGDDLKIEVVTNDDGDSIAWNMACGRAKPKITLLEHSQALEMVKDIHEHGKELKTLPKDFLEGLSLCAIKNTSAFQGYGVSGKDIFNTDGSSITNYTLSEEMDTFWMDSKAGMDVSKLEGLTEYVVSTGWVHFKADTGIVFSCRTMDHSSYPFESLSSYSERFLDTEDVSANKLPKGLGEVADRAAVLGVDVSGVMAIKLTFKKDEIEVYSERSTGNLTESAPFDVPFEEDPGIVAWVDSSFLKAAVGKVEDFHIATIDGSTTLVFYSPNYMQAVKAIILNK